MVFKRRDFGKIGDGAAPVRLGCFHRRTLRAGGAQKSKNGMGVTPDGASPSFRPGCDKKERLSRSLWGKMAKRRCEVDVCADAETMRYTLP